MRETTHALFLPSSRLRPHRCSFWTADSAWGCSSAPLARMKAQLLALLVIVLCVSSHAEPLAALHEVAVTLDARLSVELQPAIPQPSVDAETGGVDGGADSTAPAPAPAPGGAAPILQATTCRGSPSTSSYTAGWTCSATDCTATCVSGAKTPYGPATAVCDAAGNWVVQVISPGASQTALGSTSWCSSRHAACTAQQTRSVSVDSLCVDSTHSLAQLDAETLPHAR